MRSTCLAMSNLLNQVGFFGMLKYVCDIVVKQLTFTILSPDEFLFLLKQLKHAEYI